MKICVMGVGNVLLHDEGAGVRAIEMLQTGYRFDNQVVLHDGGTLGMELLQYIEGVDLLIIADVVKNGGRPGDLHRLGYRELCAKINTKNSLHEVNLTETLKLAEMMDILPPTTVVGIEPLDMSPWGTELTAPVEASMPAFVQKLLSVITEAGVLFEKIENDAAGSNDWIPGGKDGEAAYA